VPTLPPITFVALRSSEGISFGYMYLSSALKRAGARVRLVEAADAAELCRRFADHPTELVGFSTTTGLHHTYVEWARSLKEGRRVHTIFGGPHPTYFPDLVHSSGVDAVCVGEGEEALLEYLQAYAESGGPPDRPVAGFRHWRGGELLDGGLRLPPASLDALPGPDWELYFGANPRLARHPVKSFLATRGCPYRCTYCFNRELNARYRGTGVRAVRVRDAELVVNEIDEVRRRWGARLIWFLDANFAANRRWLRAFLPVYRRRIGLPFFCKVRPNVVTDELVSDLVDAGCTSVGIGVEAGDARLRNEVLERNISDEQIVRACRAFVERGVLVMSFNMVGIPGETYEMARRTLELNVESRVDYAMTMFLQPFPGTELARRAQAMGLFDGDYDALECSYFQPAPIRFPSEGDRRRITNLQRLMALAVSFPLVRRHIDRLVALPENPFYLELFKTYNHQAFHRRFYRAFELQRR